MEANEIGTQQSPKQAVTLRQGAEELLGGKWDVEEEADAGIRQPLAQKARKQEQLVVVHPDEVTRLVLLRHDVGESLVHLDVRFPVADVERHLIEQIVEEGPEDPVGEPLVVAGHLVGGQRNRHQPHGSELLIQLGLLGRCQLLGCARPSDPETTRLLVRPEEPGRQAPRAPLDLDPRVGGPNGDGKAVGDNQDAGHAGNLIRGRGGGTLGTTPGR